MNNIIEQTKNVVNGLLEAADLGRGSIVVIGCSSSEIAGGTIGKNSSEDIGKVVFETANEILAASGIYLAAQCCEHLNRAIIIEREAAAGLTEVSCVPHPKAGGSFASAAYRGFKNPIAVEFIKADAGIDIGDTLIGMHLKHVAVPLRIEQKSIGGARVVLATTRPKLIGGERAKYSL